VPPVRRLLLLVLTLPAGLCAQAAPTARAPITDTDVFLAPLIRDAHGFRLGPARNLTNRVGYDNQPSFSADGQWLYYTRMAPNAHKRDSLRDVQTDIWRINLRSGAASPVTDTYESEYSAAETSDGRSIVVVRVERDSTQQLWRLPLRARGAGGTRLVPAVKPVGYFAWLESRVAMFVLGAPATLQVADTARGTLDTIARDIGRGVKRVPGTTRVSFVQKAGDAWYLDELEPSTRQVTRMVQTLPRVEDYAWLDAQTALAGQGNTMHVWRRGMATWEPLPALTGPALGSIGRVAIDASGRWVAFTAVPAAR
jgi:hypothetical protein